MRFQSDISGATQLVDIGPFQLPLSMQRKMLPTGGDAALLLSCNILAAVSNWCTKEWPDGTSNKGRRPSAIPLLWIPFILREFQEIMGLVLLKSLLFLSGLNLPIKVPGSLGKLSIFHINN